MAIELKPVLAEIRLSIDTDSDDDIDGALSQHRYMNLDQEPNGSFAKAQSEKTQAGTNRPMQSNSIRQRRTSSSAVVSDSGRVSKRVPQVGLHQAARDNSIEIVEEWIEFLSSDSKDNEEMVNMMNARDEHGMAAIHYAAKFNRFKILVRLHEHCADVMLATDKEQYTALHYAAFFMPPYQVPVESVDSGEPGDPEADSCPSDGRKMLKYILGIANVDVNVGDKNKVSSLHLACRRGNLVAVDDLLSHPDIIPAIKDEHGDTPLHEACLHGWELIVDKLLRCSAVASNFYDSINQDCQTPLHLACQEGHTKIVKLLVKMCPPERVRDLLEAHDSRGNTALHLAVEHLGMANIEETDIVKVLLDHGANPNVEKITKHLSEHGDVTEVGDRITPLHVAARYGALNVVHLLLADERVVPDVYSTSHQTPLHFAALYNQPDIVKALTEGGAETEVKDVNSRTPFLLAAANGYREVVRELKEKTQIDSLDINRKSAIYLAAEGAHLPLLVDLVNFCESSSKKLCSAPDSHLNTPLHIAAKLGHLSIVEELLKDDLVNEGYVKIDAKNSAKKTPAHLAAENGHIKILQRLLEKCSSLVIEEDEDGNTPLHLAALNGWKHSAKLLLEKRANIEARNVTLASPLSLAAGAGYVQTVNLLLHFKAEISIRDRSQATPLHHAVLNGHVEVVKVLIDSGAKCGEKNKEGYNALDLAIECGHEDVARLIIQSDQWEQALQNKVVPLTNGSTKDKDSSTTPFRRLITKMPDVARDVLNRCITCHKGEDGERETKYNYRYLEDFCEPSSCRRSQCTNRPPLKWVKSAYLKFIEHHFRNEEHYSNTWGPEGFDKSTHPLAIMAKSSDNRLISHPLVISLLTFKLRKYASFHYITQLVCHILLLLFLSLFALLVYNPNSDICKVVFDGEFGSLINSQNFSDICNDADSLRNDTICALCGSCGNNIHQYRAVKWAAALTLVALIIRILIFLSISSIRNPFQFVQHLQNWIEVPMLICSVIFVFMFGNNCFCPASWQWQVGTAAVLLAWVDLINLIRKLQVFDIGIYILMFENIIRTFLHTILLTALLLIAFSIAFYMAFYDPSIDFAPFSNPGRSILSVLTYISSGLDYNGLFSYSHQSISEEEHRQLPFLPASVLLWITFLIIMVVLLINMLTGLAVDGIQDIRRAAKVQRLTLLVDLTLTVDSVLIYRHLFLIPERKVKHKGFSLWKVCNTFLWKGNIVQDTPETVAKTLQKQSEPTIEQVHIYTQSLVKQITSLQETVKNLNDRNRRIEVTMMHISTALGNKFNFSPDPELEFRSPLKDTYK